MRTARKTLCMSSGYEKKDTSQSRKGRETEDSVQKHILLGYPTHRMQTLPKPAKNRRICDQGPLITA